MVRASEHHELFEALQATKILDWRDMDDPCLFSGGSAAIFGKNQVHIHMRQGFYHVSIGAKEFKLPIPSGVKPVRVTVYNPRGRDKTEMSH